MNHFTSFVQFSVKQTASIEDRCDVFLAQTAQAAMFTKFIKTEQHKNNSWQLQKRLSEASVAIDDRLRQLYNDPQVLQLVR